MPISTKSYPVLKNKVSALSVLKRTRFCRRMCERLFDLSWYVRKPKLFLDSIDSSVIALRYLRKMNYERKIIINLILLKRKKNSWTLLERITNRKRYLLLIYICDERQNTFFLKKGDVTHSNFYLNESFQIKNGLSSWKKKPTQFFYCQNFFILLFSEMSPVLLQSFVQERRLMVKTWRRRKKFFFFFKEWIKFLCKSKSGQVRERASTAKIFRKHKIKTFASVNDKNCAY